MKKFGVILIIIIIIIALLIARQLTIKKPGQKITELSREHIALSASHPPYNSNPPTSGQHYGQPAAWGVYDRELPDEQLVHNLEHGGVWISYRTGIAEDTIKKLEALVNGYKSKVILTPRLKNDSNIAVAAWGRLLKLDVFNEKQIQEFIKAYKNRGPEFVPD